MDKNILEEVSIFLKNYERAANSRDFDQVTPYISDLAIFWFTDGTFAGKEARFAKPFKTHGPQSKMKPIPF